jgi:fibronectin type 3 domain-containing protein
MRKLLASCTALALVLSFCLISPAHALAPSIHFTADALPTWQTNGTVWGLAAAGGEVFAGGSFTQVRPPGTAEGDAASLNRSQLVVLDAVTGVPVSKCVLDVTRGTSTAIVRAVTTSPDKSTVYIGGLFETVGGVARRNIAAIDVATCTVKPFNPQPSSFVYAIAATTDSVYFGGTFLAVGTQARSRLGAATKAGVTLPWAPTSDDETLALAVDPNNGNVIIGGRSSTINGQDSHALAVVDGVTGTSNIHNYPKGFFPWSPGTGQRTGTSVVKTIAVDSTGFYVGNEGTGGGIFDGRAAFDWGTYNQRWRDLCLGATQGIAPVDGVLYVASHAHNCEAEGVFEDGARHFFVSETAAGKAFQPWFPQANDGIGEGIGPRAITEATTASGDFLWTGGEFTQINGVAQRGLTHFGQGPDTGAPATPQTPNVVSTAAGKATITWRTTLDDDDQNLTYTLYRGAGTSAATTLIPAATQRADSRFYSRPQLSFTDTGLTTGNTYSYRIKASDGTNVSAYSLARSVTVANADSVYPSRIQADGAAVYFRMEEPTGTAAASLGSGPLGGTYVNASTRTGQPGALVGKPDTSAAFDGVSSFLRTEVRTPAPTVYSIESWFKTTTTSGGKLVGYGNRVMLNGGTPVPLSSTYDRQIYLTNDGRLLFGVNSGALTTLSSAAGLNNGQWHHVVATQGPAGMALYLDGLRVARNAVTNAQAFSGFWRIGGDNLSGWPSKPTSNYFAGNIDETAIYNSVLSAQQVADHYRLSGQTNSALQPAPTDKYGAAVYQDGPDLFWRLGEASGTSAVDSSSSNAPGTYGTAVTRGVAGAVAGSTDTAVTVPGNSNGWVSSAASSASPSVFSEELWFKTATTTGGKLIGFGNLQSGSSTSFDKQIYLGNDGKLRFGVNSGGLKVITTPNAYNDNAWHHVVAVQDGSGTKLYLDGALAVSGTATTNQSFTGYWRVGGDNLAGWPNVPTSAYFNGSIDEVAVYPKALSAATVLTHFALGTNTPPDTQAPSVPSGLTAVAAGANVALTWTASSDDVAVTGYEVHRSATSGFAASAATKIADVTTGTSYSDANRPIGTWYYRVVAVDGAANASAASTQAVAAVADSQAPTAPTGVSTSATGANVTVSWTAATDNVGVTDYRVHRSATSGFTPDSSNKIADVASGLTYQDSARPIGTWYYRVVAVDAAGNASPPSTAASAVVADVQPPTAPTGLATTVANQDVTLNWTASTDTVGVTGYEVHRSATSGFTPDASSKIANVAAATYKDATVTGGTWYYKVIAVDAAGNTSAPSNQATATTTAPPDGEPPTAPTGLQAAVAGSTVALTWTASIDNIGVDRYRVYRSATSGFTPDGATKIADVTTGLTYSDAGRPVGSWYYRVIAVDAAGNASPPATQASATVAGGPTQNVTVSPAEDSYANQASPSNNYGTSASMASRGGASSYAAYLKFSLPAAPAGTTLVGATLSVRTTTDTFAGSVDSHVVSTAPNSWTETVLNWTNRPAIGPSIGSFAPPMLPNTRYSAILDASALTPGTVTLTVSSTSTDNLWFWSQNHAAASYRPTLVLTYQPD